MPPKRTAEPIRGMDRKGISVIQYYGRLLEHLTLGIECKLLDSAINTRINLRRALEINTYERHVANDTLATLLAKFTSLLLSNIDRETRKLSTRLRFSQV
jgi:hypothetical protein